MKRHNPDLVSLVFGLLFVLVASLWPLWRLGALDPETITWIPATALIAIGLLGLTLSVAASRRPDRRPQTDGSSTYDGGSADEIDAAYGSSRKPDVTAYEVETVADRPTSDPERSR